MYRLNVKGLYFEFKKKKKFVYKDRIGDNVVLFSI